jgi:hypothetical protein
MIKCFFVGLEFVLIAFVTVVLLSYPPGWTKERNVTASATHVEMQGL